MKNPIKPQQTRKVPKQFSWIDHRLVREHRIDQLSHPAAALYLFLLTVASAEGLSYYSDLSIMRRLSMDETTLRQARQNLIREDLVAYKKPLYQVLSLDYFELESKASVDRLPLEQPQSLGQIFQRIMEETS